MLNTLLARALAFVLIAFTGSAAASDLERSVSFSVDGETVQGTLVLPEGIETPPVALLLHGFGGTRNEWTSPHVPKGLFGEAAEILARNGIASLRIDFRGSGESDGAFAEITVERGIEDAAAALAFLREEGDVDADRVSLVGMSFGGIVASALAGREGSEIDSVVLWNPGINPPAAFAALFGVDQIRRALSGGDQPVELTLPDGNTLALRRTFWESLYRVVPAAEIARYHGPVLMAVGTKDHLVFPQPVSAEAFLSYHPGEHELWTRPVDHGFDADRTRDAVAALVEATALFVSRNFQ